MPNSLVVQKIWLAFGYWLMLRSTLPAAVLGIAGDRCKMLMRVWLSLICALVFVAFMALPGTIVPVHAEPGMQGNLPTPVQKLPKYPPVACDFLLFSSAPSRSRARWSELAGLSTPAPS